MQKTKPQVKPRAMIKVENLQKSYRDFHAVKGVSFEVYEGEIFGILGPNGAGKTTTLEILETILPKSSGNVWIDGLDLDIYPHRIKHIIGVQLQESGYYPNLNLIETLNFFADIYGADTKAIDLLEKVNLQDKATNRVDMLSGGQKQRFSIATTLVADPKIIFLDEPTTGLDPQARRNLWGLIRDLKNQGKTIVLTTHYMDEAEELCDRIGIMEGGKMIKINTARQFIQDLLDTGFVKPQPKMGASLEDVFLELTGKSWKD